MALQTAPIFARSMWRRFFDWFNPGPDNVITRNSEQIARLAKRMEEARDQMKREVEAKHAESARG